MRAGVLAAAAGAATCWAVLERRSAQLARAEAIRTAESAGTCSLTGLARRERWMPWARTAAADTGSAIAFLDLDGFKIINDRHGHQAGNEVLAQVAARLVAHLPEALAGRAGGDEFIIIANAESAWRAVVDAVVQPYRITTADHHPEGGDDETTVVVGASLGVARCDGRRDVNTLLAAADRAMYEAKRGGGGVRFAGALDEPPAATLTAREQMIAELVVAGRTNREIAAELFIAESTVRWNLRTVHRKVGTAGDRARLASALRRLGVSAAAPPAHVCAS